MSAQRYEVESLGPVIRAIKKRQNKLKSLRPLIAKSEQKRLDLRLQALEQSREILSRACKVAPKMNVFYAGADD
jgi:hypothetical protein